MKPQQFEDKMRSGEVFHGLRVPDGKWTVIRVDGRGFSRFTQLHFSKPFDPRFHDLMLVTAQALLEEWEGLYCYVESDEISILLPRAWAHFDRSVEKLVSLTAATASVTFSSAGGERAYFDSRIWCCQNDEDVFDYFRWRQSDATRCALNGWCYWTLRQQGLSARQATASLDRQTIAQKYALLQERGIDFDALPSWQRRGVGLYWENYEKLGFNPRTNANTVASRRRVCINRELPNSDDYVCFLSELLR